MIKSKENIPKNLKEYFKINRSIKSYKIKNSYSSLNKSKNKQDLYESNFYIHQNNKCIKKNEERNKQITETKKSKIGYFNSLFKEYNFDRKKDTINKSNNFFKIKKKK